MRLTLTLAIVTAGVTACGTDSTPAVDFDHPDQLGAPTSGFQLRAGEGLIVEPGTEIEYCEILALPGGPSDEVWVRRMESAMVRGSHHLIISAVEPGSAMDARLTTGDRQECRFGARQLGDESEDIFGSQTPYRTDTLPRGVGRRLFGGQKIVVDYHYFNATRAPIEVAIAINVHTTTADKIEHIVRTDGFYNFTIDIPPRETKSFTGECRFDQDVSLHKLIRHTHRWGRDFDVWFVGGARDGELVFSSDHYEDTDYAFATPPLVRAGEGFRFRCEFTNTESNHLVFGNSVKDEMCILFASFWSAEGREVADQSCYLQAIDRDGVARP